jgi:hypothetical protein
MTRAKTSRLRALVIILGAVVLFATGAVATWTVATAQMQHQHGAEPAKGGWLVKLAPDARPEAIQRQLRGFETTMAEVSYRYGEMYFGGVEGNWDYAAHMAMTLERALRVGLERSRDSSTDAHSTLLIYSLRSRTPQRPIPRNARRIFVICRYYFARSFPICNVVF